MNEEESEIRGEIKNFKSCIKTHYSKKSWVKACHERLDIDLPLGPNYKYCGQELWDLWNNPDKLSSPCLNNKYNNGSYSLFELKKFRDEYQQLSLSFKKEFNRSVDRAVYLYKCANMPSKLWVTKFVHKTSKSIETDKNLSRPLNNFFTKVDIYPSDFSTNFIIVDYIFTLSTEAASKLKNYIEHKNRDNVDEFIEKELDDVFKGITDKYSQNEETSKYDYSVFVLLPNDYKYLEEAKNIINLKSVIDNKFFCINDILFELRNLKNKKKLFINFDIARKVNYFLFDRTLNNDLESVININFYLIQSLNIISTEYQNSNYMYKSITDVRFRILKYEQNYKNYEKAASDQIKCNEELFFSTILSNDWRKYCISSELFNDSLAKLENGEFYKNGILEYTEHTNNEIKQNNQVINEKIDLLKSLWDEENRKITRHDGIINTWASVLAVIIATISLITSLCLNNGSLVGKLIHILSKSIK